MLLFVAPVTDFYLSYSNFLFLHSMHTDLLSLPDTTSHRTVGDNSLALSTACKSLSVCVQLLGLDSQDAAQHHGQVAALLADRGKSINCCISA